MTDRTVDLEKLAEDWAKRRDKNMMAGDWDNPEYQGYIRIDLFKGGAVAFMHPNVDTSYGVDIKGLWLDFLESTARILLDVPDELDK